MLLFVFYAFAAGSTAVSLLCMGKSEITVRKIIATAVFHGLIGGGLGMQVYEWRKVAWAAFMAAVGYGAGVIKISQSKAIIRAVVNDEPGPADT